MADYTLGKFIGWKKLDEVIPPGSTSSIVLPPAFWVLIVSSFVILSQLFLYPIMSPEGTRDWFLQVGRLLAIACLLNLGGAIFVDPGTVFTGPEEHELLENPALSPPDDVPLTRTRGCVKSALIAGQTVEFRWCDSCLLWRPPRASHCSICKRCFERFDHHCPFIGTCVAKNNQRFFVGFFICAAAAVLCLVGALLCYINENFPTNPNGAWTLPTQWPAAVLLSSLLCAFLASGFCGLCIIVSGLIVMLGCDCTLKEMVTHRGGGLPRVPPMLGPNGIAAWLCAPLPIRGRVQKKDDDKKRREEWPEL